MPTFICVVIPTYNRQVLLSRCIDALILQNFPKEFFEVIVVADGPDPLTANLVSEIKENNPGFQINYFALPEKKGPAAARNYGWKQSSGELVAFTDDDCIPSESWLNHYWKAFQMQDEWLVSFTGKVIVPVPETPTDYQKNVSHLATADFITANCACSREALELVHGFDEEFPAAWREDSAFEFELLKHNVPIIRLNDAEVIHPCREAPWGVSILDQKKSMFNALLFKKYPGFYREKIASHPVWDYYGIIFFSMLSIILFLTGNMEEGTLSLAMWLFITVRFIYKRLKGTDVSFSHRLEMIITSLLIPYLSVYWTLRGAVRYKVFFL